MAKRRRQSYGAAPCAPDNSWRARFAAREAAEKILKESDDFSQAVERLTDSLEPKVKRIMSGNKLFTKRKKK